MSTTFTQLFQQNIQLADPDRKRLVDASGRLTFDDLLVRRQIDPADLSNRLRSYGWIWLHFKNAKGEEQDWVLHDCTEDDTALAYFDTRKGESATISLLELSNELFHEHNTAEALSKCLIRLAKPTGEGASPSYLPDPYQTYLGEVINDPDGTPQLVNRIQLWRKKIAQIAQEEYVIWAKDAALPDNGRLTEATLFESADYDADLALIVSDPAKIDLYKRLMLSRKYAFAIQFATTERDKEKERREEQIKLIADAAIKAQEEVALNVAMQAYHDAITELTRLKTAQRIPADDSAKGLEFLKALKRYTESTTPPQQHPGNIRGMQRIMAYAQSNKVGLPIVWKSITDQDGAAWSANFISFVMQKAITATEQHFLDAGKTNYLRTWKKHFGFKPGQRHMIYVAQALVNRLNRDYSRPFWLYAYNEVKASIRVGDIIVKNYPGVVFDIMKMTDIVTYTASTKLWTVSNDKVNSHSDVVFEIVGNMAHTMGGNTKDLTGVVNTVGRKQYQLQIPGYHTVIHETDIHGSRLPPEENTVWGVIRIIDQEIENEWQNGDVATPEDEYAEIFGDSKPAVIGKPQKNAP